MELNRLRCLYFYVKPFIPRTIQLFIRSVVVRCMRKKYAAVWPITECAATPPVDWKGWPEGKQFALILNHDVDTQRGHDKSRCLMDLDQQLGVVSTFYLVPERYQVSDDLLKEIKSRGFGCGVHGLKHDGKLFLSQEVFRDNAARINHYLRSWDVKGFSSPSMIRRLEWMHLLDIEYSTSTFDTDPFEPQPAPGNTIFPSIIHNGTSSSHFVELPYTLPQDFTLFILLGEKNIDIWKRKLDWVARHGGMALVNTHPDYMSFNGHGSNRGEEYPVELYREFIAYVQTEYAGNFWNPLAQKVANYVNLTYNDDDRRDGKQPKIRIDSESYRRTDPARSRKIEYAFS